MQPRRPSAGLFYRRLLALWDVVGRRLKIDVRYFAKTSTILTLHYALSVLSGLVTGYLVALLLPPEAYGGYRFSLSVAGIVSLLTLPSLETAIAREVANRQRDAAVRFTLMNNAWLCLAGALVLLGLVPVLGLWWNQERLGSLFIVIALLFLPLQLGATFFSGIVTGTGNFRFALHVKMFATALVVCLLPAVLTVTHSLPIIYAVAVGVPGLVVASALALQLRRFPSRERSWRVLRYGGLLSLNTIPVSIASQLDSFVIAGLFGLKQLALFQVSILVPEQIKAWFKSLLPASFSRLATMDDSRQNRRRVLKVTAALTLGVTVGVAGYVLLAPWLCAWLFPNYTLTDVVWLSRLSAVTLVAIPSLLVSQYLEAHGRLRALQIANWGSMTLFVATLLVLTPLLGLMGAVLARATMRLTFALLCILALALGVTAAKPASPH